MSRKVSLPRDQKRQVPFGPPRTVEDLLAARAEARGERRGSMDGNVQRSIVSSLDRHPVPSPQPDTARSGTSSDEGGIVASMAKRLSAAEKEIQQLRSALKSKDLSISQLTLDNDKLQTSLSKAQAAASSLSLLMKDNVRLKKQVYDMESFLHDFGLIWVGDNSPDEDGVQHLSELDSGRNVSLRQGFRLDGRNAVNPDGTLAAEAKSVAKMGGQIGGVVALGGAASHAEKPEVDSSASAPHPQPRSARSLPSSRARTPVGTSGPRRSQDDDCAPSHSDRFKVQDSSRLGSSPALHTETDVDAKQPKKSGRRGSHNLLATPIPDSQHHTHTNIQSQTAMSDAGTQSTPRRSDPMASSPSPSEDRARATSSYVQSEKKNSDSKGDRRLRETSPENAPLARAPSQTSVRLRDVGAGMLNLPLTTPPSDDADSPPIEDILREADARQSAINRPQCSCPLDMTSFTQCVEDLNTIAGPDTYDIGESSGGVHKFKDIDRLDLTIFANGMMLRAGPLRPFDEPSAKAFLRDILDGYFPFELKTMYPEGVHFNLVNRSSEHYTRPSVPFAGHGRSLHDQSLSSSGGGTGSGQGQKAPESVSRVCGMERVSGTRPEATIAREDFLRRLPEKVIVNGQVVAVRGEVAGVLSGDGDGSKGNDVVVVRTPVLDQLGEGTTRSDISTLRIRSEDGRRTFIVKLLFDDTIATLRVLLAKYREKCKEDYVLKSTYPKRTYDDHAMTLRSAGLVPNASLLMEKSR